MIHSKQFRDIPWLGILSALIVAALDALTNSINTQNNAWDFTYYIALAKDGFHAQTMASPFVYRYVTPFIAHGISLLGISIENGFRVVAYVGAIAQLMGIFFFVSWLTKSSKGAYLALGATALSLFNVKFLLFDVYRPDHLAYALILLQTYFAFEKKFLPLLVTTIIASQIREFNIVPLAAYLFALFREEDRPLWFKQTAVSALCLAPCIILPRVLIPVTENYQIVGLSQEGIVTALILPFIPTVDINFLFSIIAYLLPILLIANPKTIKSAFASLEKFQRGYILAYIVLVLILSFLGGTDFFRFATFLFLPQIIIFGLLAPNISNVNIAFMLPALFIFNRIWMPIPDWDAEKYRDFYGGFSLRLNIFTLYRFLECAVFIALGYLARRTSVSSLLFRHD